MGCTDCHTPEELHGDGTAYNSMFDEGATEVRCETCHTEVESNLAHNQHAANLTCSSCHMETAVTCVNCHFEFEVSEHRKVAAGKYSGWVFLGNWRDKVATFNFQSVKYQDQSFVAYGPFVGHTVTREGRDCGDCHGNPYVLEYQKTGSIQVVWWDEDLGKLVNAKGVIPIPPDYETALKHDFAKLVDGQLVFMEAGPDNAQMLYGEPLTQAQIALLGPGSE
jgi:hypothetical protein